MVSISAALLLNTFSSFLLTPHFEKASWIHFPQKKGSSLETPMSERGHKVFQLCSHLLWAMVYTSSHLSAPMTLWQSTFDVFQIFFRYFSDVFRYFSFKFSCLSEVALQNLSLGLPFYSFTVNLPEHTITYFLVRTHFITLGQSENWDTTSPMHLLALPSWGSFTSDITTLHL